MQTTATHTPVNIEERKRIQVTPGDTVRVHQKIQEKGKTRIQVFEGVVLATKHGAEPGATFTVRRTTGGVGVERIFPLFSPVIDRIEVVKRAKVRRSKLYHIRDKVSKEIRRQMRRARLVSETTLSEQDEAKRVEQEAKAAEEEAAQKAEEEAKKAAEAEEKKEESEVAPTEETPKEEVEEEKKD